MEPRTANGLFITSDCPVYRNKNKKLLLIFAFGLMAATMQPQCASSQGPNSGTFGGNASLLGSIAWGGIANIFSSNNAYASATAVFYGDNTNYLWVTGFGFTIPATATVCGIEAQVERSATGVFPTVLDNVVQIVKGGVILGTNMAQPGAWPVIDGAQVYGSNSSNWGASWTPADINSANFGLAMSANLSAGGILPTARVDHVTLKVYYTTVVLPVELVDFTAKRNGAHSVLFTWITATETNNNFFTVEQSANGGQWREVGRVKGLGNTRTQHNYELVSNNESDELNYYRLKQTDVDGTAHYSHLITLPAVGTKGNTLTVAFDEAGNFLNVSSLKNISRAELLDMHGKVLEAIEPLAGSAVKNLQLPLDIHEKGVYVVQMTDEDGGSYFKKIVLH